MDINKIINEIIDERIKQNIENIKKELELDLLLRIRRDQNNIIEKNKDYKIALCLSGHTRNFLKPYYALQKYLLDKYEIDIFIHTWAYDGHLENLHDTSGNHRKIIENKNKVDQETLKLLYKPKNLIIEDPTSNNFILNIPKKIKLNNYKSKGPILNNYNVWSQMYSIYNANKLKIEYEKKNNFEYDFVIRMRFDHILDQFKHEWLDYRKITKYSDAFWVAPNDINNKLTDLFNNYYSIFILVKMFNIELFFDYLYKKLKTDEEIEDIITLQSIIIQRKDNEEIIFEKKK
jgi:hypothetical protein